LRSFRFWCLRDFKSEAQLEKNIAGVVLNTPCILGLGLAICHALLEGVWQLVILRGTWTRSEGQAEGEEGGEKEGEGTGARGRESERVCV